MLKVERLLTNKRKMNSIKRIYVVLILVMSISYINAQENFGTNDKTGRYLNVGDANIYYEVYGQGRPIILLHGGLYGYINEYEDYIVKLSESFKVIAIALRGHGRSEIGTKVISYKLLAEDAIAILRKECNDSAYVIGFSDGGITAYVMAVEYQSEISKVVSIGGGLSLSGYSSEGLEWLKNITPENFEKNNSEFILERKKIMPQPERWNEFLEKMKNVWTEPVWVSPEKAQNIKCPVLTIGGDRDDFFSIDHFIQTYKLIPNSQLAIIPNSGHLESMTKPIVLEHIVIPFLLE